MSGFELRDRGDGNVDLVEIVPTVIATFTDRAHAERYFNVLTGSGAPDQPQGVVTIENHAPGVDVSLQEASAEGGGPVVVVSPTDPMPIVKRKSPPVAPVQAPPSDEPDEAQWTSAFKALADGGDLKTEADKLSVDFHKLRGKYARWCRDQKEAAVEPAAASDQSSRVDCRLCGRAFKETPESDGLCARCFHG
ncbi:hypothetical protein [Chachezhania sediminis]|uniref:hypothetical protein n=1 Tax=Chachezhania sediminis TaxID=2599291 RepID=UPI00131BCED8|nr:hypothetical protein [Chachezhania sediminis]